MKDIMVLNNVRKVYRVGNEKIIALDNINLAVKQGEICCFLGTSGSGKSTLLNIMAGLEKPTRGEIILCDTHIEKLNERQLARFRRKHIGFVFQSYNLLPHLTALENVSLPLIFRKVPGMIRKKRAMKMLELVGLQARARHKPSQMSGGQQQRVGIARAFVSKPSIVFADEPTGNLDSKTTEEVMGTMLKMARENMQTLILVTHDVGIASYADIVIHIHDGAVTQVEKKMDQKCEECTV